MSQPLWFICQNPGLEPKHNPWPFFSKTLKGLFIWRVGKTNKRISVPEIAQRPKQWRRHEWIAGRISGKHQAFF